jgi:hypothetical protein
MFFHGTILTENQVSLGERGLSCEVPVKEITDLGLNKKDR